MPNTAVWGNDGDDRIEEQDLITPENPAEGDPAIIRVNDVDNNDADRPAIYAKNSNAGADARALMVEGKAEVADLDANSVALKSTNKHVGAGARALYTEGQVELVAGLTGNPEITAVKIYNPSTAAGVTGAHALVVTGRSHKAVQISNDQDDADKKALSVYGNTHLQSMTAADEPHITLKVENGNENLVSCHSNNVI